MVQKVWGSLARLLFLSQLRQRWIGWLSFARRRRPDVLPGVERRAERDAAIRKLEFDRLRKIQGRPDAFPGDLTVVAIRTERNRALRTIEDLEQEISLQWCDGVARQARPSAARPAPRQRRDDRDASAASFMAYCKVTAVPVRARAEQLAEGASSVR